MLDIGMTELLVIGVVALIVVGPKDLPGMFRAIGRFTAKARQMGRQFTQAMNDAADQTGMKDAADGLKAAANPRKFGMDKLNEAASSFEKWDPTKSSTKPEKKPEDTERAADAAKIRDAMKEKGQAKRDGEKAQQVDVSDSVPAAVDDGAAPTIADEAPAAKAPAKKAAAKKPAAKKTTDKKPAAKTTTDKKTTAKKPTAKKTTAAKKPAAKKASAQKAAPKKAASE